MSNNRPICDLPGCNRGRRRKQRLCESHYRALPGDLRSAIIDTHDRCRFAAWEAAIRRAADWLDERRMALAARTGER